MINFEYSDIDNMVYANYSGSIEVQDVKDYIDEFLSDDSLPRELYVLEDATNAHYNFGPRANAEIMQKLEYYAERFTFIKVAFVQNKPKETAINVHYGYQMKLKNVTYEVFTYRKSALKWLKAGARSK